jgi:hypothetical protein
MGGDPVADLSGIALAAVVEPAVLVATARRVSLGLGVTQQHQTAHGILESFHVQNNLQAAVEDKVTNAGYCFEHDLRANAFCVCREENRFTLFWIML